MAPKPTTRPMFETEDLPLFSGTAQAVTGDPFKPTTAYRQARIAALPPMLDSRLSFLNADSHDEGPAPDSDPCIGCPDPECENWTACDLGRLFHHDD